MTEEEVSEIMDKSNFWIDSANPYDMKIIEALEKQIPKEVSTMKYRNDYDWTCNSCGTTFEYIRYTADKPNYCPNCGQAIKWE